MIEHLLRWDKVVGQHEFLGRVLGQEAVGVDVPLGESGLLVILVLLVLGHLRAREDRGVVAGLRGKLGELRLLVPAEELHLIDVGLHVGQEGDQLERVA